MSLDKIPAQIATARQGPCEKMPPVETRDKGVRTRGSNLDFRHHD